MLSRLGLLALCATAASAENYAVLVAGSSSWMNYRHQADIAHAYQILTKGGVKKENIITMMYDDIANNDENPFPGKLYNQPADDINSANEVYASVADHIDYKGGDVTPANFAAVLTGDKSSVNGGNGRVLESGPDDNVFVNFADHGGTGLIAFPTQTMSTQQFQSALNTMYEKKMYKQLVFYMEACESGSMWTNFPTDQNVYALSAANGQESSWGAYCDVTLDGHFMPCLGDLFSINWMENADVTKLTKETLASQYTKVKALTTKSHVMQWGDVSMASEESSVFEGKGDTFPTKVAASEAGQMVSSRDVKLHYLYSKYVRVGTPEVAAELKAEIAHRESEDAKYARLAKALDVAADFDALAAPEVGCWHVAHEAVGEFCGGYSDYSLKHSRVVAGACNRWSGDSAKVVNALRAVCQGY